MIAALIAAVTQLWTVTMPTAPTVTVEVGDACYMATVTRLEEEEAGDAFGPLLAYERIGAGVAIVVTSCDGSL